MTIISRILYKTIVSKSEKKVYFDRSRKTGMTMSYLVTKVFIEFDSSCGYSNIRRFETRKLLVWGILFWYDFWISGWNSGKHWHYWIHNGLSREIMIITLHPLRGCRPQHMKCATNLWKTKLQLFDSLVPAVFTMTAQADQAGADAAPQHSDNSTYFVLIALAGIEWWGSEKAEIAK